jgi:hypothetical protein
LINHYESRKFLERPYEDSKQRLKGVLYVHAESLVGQIEFGSSAQNDVKTRLASDPGNSVLTQAMLALAAKKNDAMENLSSATNLWK